MKYDKSVVERLVYDLHLDVEELISAHDKPDTLIKRRVKDALKAYDWFNTQPVFTDAEKYYMWEVLDNRIKRIYLSKISHKLYIWFYNLLLNREMI